MRTCDVENFLKQLPYEVSSQWEQSGGGSWVFRIPALKPILLSNFRQKRIPSEYKCASISQRWALLQGLMDSDGFIGTVRSQSTYVSTVKGLAEDVPGTAVEPWREERHDRIALHTLWRPDRRDAVHHTLYHL